MQKQVNTLNITSPSECQAMHNAHWHSLFTHATYMSITAACAKPCSLLLTPRTVRCHDIDRNNVSGHEFVDLAEEGRSSSGA